MEHIRQIMSTLGSPPEEDLQEFPKAAAWILNNPTRGISFQRLYPQYDNHTICLLDYLLQFNPYKRPSVDLALKHIYFQPQRQNPMVIAYHEFNCLSLFDSSYEDTIQDDEDIKLLILKEVGKNRLGNSGRNRSGNRGGNLIMNTESRFYKIDESAQDRGAEDRDAEGSEGLEDSESFQDLKASQDI